MSTKQQILSKLEEHQKSYIKFQQDFMAFASGVTSEKYPLVQDELNPQGIVVLHSGHAYKTSKALSELDNLESLRQQLLTVMGNKAQLLTDAMQRKELIKTGNIKDKIQTVLPHDELIKWWEALMKLYNQRIQELCDIAELMDSTFDATIYKEPERKLSSTFSSTMVRKIDESYQTLKQFTPDKSLKNSHDALLAKSKSLRNLTKQIHTQERKRYLQRAHHNDLASADAFVKREQRKLNVKQMKLSQAKELKQQATLNSDKPIAAIFTSFTEPDLDRMSPDTRLQQLDKVGIHTVYILVSHDELTNAKNNKYKLFDGDEDMTIIDYYHSYLPKSEKQISFKIIDTKDITSEQDKIDYFLQNTNDDNLINLCFCNESTLPWINEKFSSSAIPLHAKQTSVEFLGYTLYENTEFDLPETDQRRSPIAADELLQRDTNPTLCYPRSMWDIVNYQALFNCFVELMTVQLNNDHHQDTTSAKYELENLINRYANNLKQLETANKTYEEAHKHYWRNTDGNEPNTSYKHSYQQALEQKTKAELAFPTLIKEMISTYTRLLDSQPTLPNIPRY